MTETIEENTAILHAEAMLELIDDALVSVAHKSIVSAGEIADVLLDIRSIADSLCQEMSAKERRDDTIEVNEP